MRQNATLQTHPRAKAQQQTILSALRHGSTRQAAADVARVHRATFYRWLKFPDFYRDVCQAEAQAEGLMTAAILRASQAGDWRASLAWLERRRRADWGKSIDLRQIDDETLLRLLEERVSLPGGAQL